MKKKSDFSLKINIFIIFIFILAFSPSLYKNIKKIYTLEEELSLYKDKKNTLNTEIIQYENNINDLKKDFFREEIARNQLNLIKPGEVIYKISK